MNKIKLNCISLNGNSLNSVGEVRKGDSGGDSTPVEKPIGIFIYTTDGEFITSDAWDSANNDKAVGVFVNDGEHDFVIGGKEAAYTRFGGFGKLIGSIPAYSNFSDARLDFDGANNTPKIIEELRGYNDGASTGAPACEACANYVFPNGKNGYFPAFGELALTFVNINEVDNALSKCGGKKMRDTAAISSTQYDAENCWRYVLYSGGPSGSYSKKGNASVRAFCKI